MSVPGILRSGHAILGAQSAEELYPWRARILFVELELWQLPEKNPKSAAAELQG